MCVAMEAVAWRFARVLNSRAGLADCRMSLLLASKARMSPPAPPVMPNFLAMAAISAPIALSTARMRRAVSGRPVPSNLPRFIALRTFFGTSSMRVPKMSITACLKASRVALFRFFSSSVRVKEKCIRLFGASVWE